MTLKDNIKRSDLLIKLRSQYNLTQDELANILKVTKTSISNWENGGAIKPEYLKALARLYNVSIKELLEGKLSDQSSKAFIEDEYTLWDFSFDEGINEENYEDLEEYYDQIYKIQTEFFKLLEIRFTREFSDLENEEFIFLNRYFMLNNIHYEMIRKEFPTLEELNLLHDEFMTYDFINALLVIYKNRKNEYMWEVKNSFERRYELGIKEVLSTNDEVLINKLLKVLYQSEKDALLTGNLDKLSTENNSTSNNYQPSKNAKLTDVIESSNIFKLMINNGCRLLFSYRSFSLKPIGPIEEGFSDSFEGSYHKINESMSNHSIYGDKLEHIILNNHGFYYRDENWRFLTLDEYESLVDYRTTKYLQALVNYKDKEPLKYFDALKEFCNFE